MAEVYGEAWIYKTDVPATPWEMLTPDDLRKIEDYFETNISEANRSR